MVKLQISRLNTVHIGMGYSFVWDSNEVKRANQLRPDCMQHKESRFNKYVLLICAASLRWPKEVTQEGPPL